MEPSGIQAMEMDGWNEKKDDGDSDDEDVLDDFKDKVASHFTSTTATVNVVADSAAQGQESASETQQPSKTVKVGVLFSPSVRHLFDLARKEFLLLRKQPATGVRTGMNQEVDTDMVNTGVSSTAAVGRLGALPGQRAPVYTGSVDSVGNVVGQEATV